MHAGYPLGPVPGSLRLLSDRAPRQRPSPGLVGFLVVRSPPSAISHQPSAISHQSSVIRRIVSFPSSPGLPGEVPSLRGGGGLLLCLHRGEGTRGDPSFPASKGAKACSHGWSAAQPVQQEPHTTPSSRRGEGKPGTIMPRVPLERWCTCERLRRHDCAQVGKQWQPDLAPLMADGRWLIPDGSPPTLTPQTPRSPPAPCDPDPAPSHP